MHKGIHNQFRLSILAAVASAALLPIPAAAGETMFKLLRVLKDKGSISEGEYQMLLEAAREETAPKAASAPPAPPAVRGRSQPLLRRRTSRMVDVCSWWAR